jgi:hypothetical protein
MSPLLPHAAQSFLDAGGAVTRHLALVVMGLVALLLLEVDVLYVRGGGNSRGRLGPLGIALMPLGIACGIVIAHRWRQFSR